MRIGVRLTFMLTGFVVLSLIPPLASYAQDFVGTSEDDTIYGTNDADYILAGDGADFVRGRDGDDRIYGERGNDVIDGTMAMIIFMVAEAMIF